MGGRRKNPHPKRARNVKTVLKGDEKEERGRGEEKEGDEELRLLRMLRCGSCEDDENVVMEQNHHHVPKAFIIPAAKGVKRKRGQHECDVCEKSFRDSNSLKAHMRIHTNEKPYECEVCEMKFRHSGSLKTHMRIHTNEKRMHAMCARSVLVILVILQSTCVFTRRRNRMNAMCSRSVFVDLVL